MDIQSSLLSTDMGLTRNNAALSAVKQSIDQAHQMNKMVQDKEQSVSTANETRGTLLDILV